MTTRTPKPGRVIVRFSKTEDDIMIAWGDNISRGNPSYILDAFCGIYPSSGKKFFRELEARGFDLSSLKFQIDLTPERLAEKKAAQENE